MRLVAAVLLAALVSGAALHVDAAPDVDQYGTGGIRIRDEVPGTLPQVPRTPRSKLYSYQYVALRDGALCWAWAVTSDPEVARAFNEVYSARRRTANRLDEVPPCPAAAAPRPPTPGELARDFWDVRHLPRPQPKVVPDYAVVGKRVYLQITGAPSRTFDVPNPIGPAVRIDATSRYVVDWGDGTITTTTSQGGPWPDGDVTHVYATAHTRVTIRVTQVWSATWTAGAATRGRLGDLRTGGEVTISVQQVQPVRNR